MTSVQQAGGGPPPPPAPAERSRRTRSPRRRRKKTQGKGTVGGASWPQHGREFPRVSSRGTCVTRTLLSAARYRGTMWSAFAAIRGASLWTAAACCRFGGGRSPAARGKCWRIAYLPFDSAPPAAGLRGGKRQQAAAVQSLAALTSSSLVAHQIRTRVSPHALYLRTLA